jgi:hypothetical protein
MNINRKVVTSDFSVVERVLTEAEWLHASLKENLVDRGDVDCTAFLLPQTAIFGSTQKRAIAIAVCASLSLTLLLLCVRALIRYE